MAESRDELGHSPRIRVVASANRNPTLLERRRREIIDAASVEFRKNGFHATSVERIARRVGVDKRTLYDYLETKQDILYLVFVDYFERQWKHLDAALDPTLEPTPRLLRLVEANIHFVDDNRDLVLLLFRELRYLDRDSIESVLELIHSVVRTYERLIEEAAVKHGTQSVEPRIAAQLVLGMVDMIALAHADLAEFGVEQVIEHVLRMIQHGLYPPSAVPPAPSEAA